MPSLHPAIARLAARQLGLVTRPQMLEEGLTYSALRRSVDAGRLEPIGWQTFRIAGAPTSFEASTLAACLDNGAVASHRSAARLHGLAGFERSSIVEVSVTRRRRRSSTLAVVHATTNLPSDDLVDIGPIPATSVARTILGLAALVPHEVGAEQVRKAVEAGARQNPSLDRWLCWRLEVLRCRGRNGVTVMEGILRARMRMGPTESWLERETLRLLEEAGLPLPSVQRRIRRRGMFVARVDLLYDAARVVIEVDGHASHRTREQTAADSRRQNELILAGYRVLRFTYDDVSHRPRQVVSHVAEALGLHPPALRSA